MTTALSHRILSAADVLTASSRSDDPVEPAHAAMQHHVRCHTESCGQRRDALRALVNAGRYVLAAGPDPRTRP